MVMGPDRGVLHTASGSSVGLARRGDAPWLGLRRVARAIRAIRAPIAIEDEEPDATRAATADLVPAPRLDAPAPAEHPAAGVPVDRGGPACRGPAPTEISEEARPSRGVKVPVGPSPAE